jgi:hypothetical protein
VWDDDDDDDKSSRIINSNWRVSRRKGRGTGEKDRLVNRGQRRRGTESGGGEKRTGREAEGEWGTSLKRMSEWRKRRRKMSFIMLRVEREDEFRLLRWRKRRFSKDAILGGSSTSRSGRRHCRCLLLDVHGSGAG